MSQKACVAVEAYDLKNSTDLATWQANCKLTAAIDIFNRIKKAES